MSQQGPIIVVSTAERPSFASALDDAKMFPIIDTAWADASRAIEQLQPAAVLAAMPEAVEADFEILAKRISAQRPYRPLLSMDPRKCHSFLPSKRQFRPPGCAPARRAAYQELARHRDAPA